MVSPLPKHRAREYETIFIVHPDTQVDAIEQIAGRVTDAIDRLEGKLTRAENWGKRRLAYPVRKQAQGYYLYLRYLGYSDLVHEIERNLRMIEPVLKYLSVKIDEDVDPAARPVSENEISFAPQIDEEPESEPETTSSESEPETTSSESEPETTSTEDVDDNKDDVEGSNVKVNDVEDVDEIDSGEESEEKKDSPEAAEEEEAE